MTAIVEVSHLDAVAVLEYHDRAADHIRRSARRIYLHTMRAALLLELERLGVSAQRLELCNSATRRPTSSDLALLFRAVRLAQDAQLPPRDVHRTAAPALSPGEQSHKGMASRRVSARASDRVRDASAVRSEMSHAPAVSSEVER